MALATVDYNTLDQAKESFIAASARTLKFAQSYGFVPGERLGASANIFALNLKDFFDSGQNQIYFSLVPEGLGTADDSRPEDLTSQELKEFWFNIGIKSVAVMTNDAATAGIQPLAIGLYMPSSTPETVFTTEFLSGFLDGFVEGCRKVQCVYLAGETPQLKTKMLPDRLDIAGAVCGVLPVGAMPIDGSKLAAGDKIVFVASSGPHENGFTTLREISARLQFGYRTKDNSGVEFWRGINAASMLYSPLVQSVLAHGIAPTNLENITGHGWQKIMRSGSALRYRISKVLPIPPVFELIEQVAGISRTELISIFNFGVGFAIFVRSNSEAEQVCLCAQKLGMQAAIAGEVEAAPQREVIVEPWQIKLHGQDFKLSKKSKSV